MLRIAMIRGRSIMHAAEAAMMTMKWDKFITKIMSVFDEENGKLGALDDGAFTASLNSLQSKLSAVHGHDVFNQVLGGGAPGRGEAAAVAAAEVESRSMHSFARFVLQAWSHL
eukprot:4400878-Pyramimonas_sp.AAC.1